MENVTQKIGRVLFGLPFLVFGVLHFMNASGMAGMVPIPGGVFWVYVTGVALILATISFVANKYVFWAAWGLAIFLFLTAITVHLPGVIDGIQANMSGFLKDISLMGAALYFAGKSSEEIPV